MNSVLGYHRSHGTGFDIGGVVGILVMGTMLVVSSIKNTHTLYQLERLP